MCTVFAQLTVRDKWEGPHVFVVRLRDDQGRTMPGVRILDNGAKVGSSGACPLLSTLNKEGIYITTSAALLVLLYLSS